MIQKARSSSDQRKSLGSEIVHLTHRQQKASRTFGPIGYTHCTAWHRGEARGFLELFLFVITQGRKHYRT